MQLREADALVVDSSTTGLKSGLVDPDTFVPRYRVLTPAARARLPFSLWQSLTVRAFTSAFWHAEAFRPEVTETTLFDAIFLFARRSVHFRLFGRPGLAEYQALVPHDGTETFLRELRQLILSTRGPSIMLSLKAFKGTQRLASTWSSDCGSRRSRLTSMSAIRAWNGLNGLPSPRPGPWGEYGTQRLFAFRKTWTSGNPFDRLPHARGAGEMWKSPAGPGAEVT